MDAKAIAGQLRIRINNDKAHFKGQLPERFAIAWHAYLLAVVEWGVIDQGTCDQLLRLLPAVEDDPSIAIALGREDPDETTR
jgi:hypothetical protein